MQQTVETTITSDAAAAPVVRQFRQILIWPLQLMPLKEDAAVRAHWELLEQQQDADAPVWTALTDEFPDDPAAVQERHYREFVTFLPHAQRFLYGERASRTTRTSYGDSPIKIYRRRDVREVRVTMTAGAPPLTLTIAHIDLYFFFDVDVVMLVFEMAGADLPLSTAHDLIHRFGRAYPSGWAASGEGANCPAKVEWLDERGKVLAVSDFDDRAKFTAAVCRSIAPAIAAHWEFLLKPLRLNHEDITGTLRYRQLEHYRMPMMVYLAVDNPRGLTRADYVRLGLAVPAFNRTGLPYSEAFLRDFETRYCYDRYHDPARGGDWVDTRVICTGHTLVAVGDVGEAVFTDPERGFLAQFRHQIFLVGMIAHFHRAALLMMSDRLVSIITRLDVRDHDSVRSFRRDIREMQEVFLRFSHRYWFSEVSDQAMVRDLSRMWSDHLALKSLYAGLRDEIGDMSHYLDSDMLRRQSTTIVRLTVVTMLSILGTVSTGFLGMNLFAMADQPASFQLSVFFVVLTVTTLLTYVVLRRSQPLSEFLDAVSDPRAGVRAHLSALVRVLWSKRRR
ncbi:CorA family divalent cation transporter [Blastochloris viridis]|uniref:CorA-like Mg2+ transporter protein n=1 Tax=Blastochloris viridis TaxID=1079 RepID=A0A182D4K6_BLAVI|nr:CorA family divalent cation transporter [Blastochloris viridis]ALK09726.1 CorA-like Mg2+ transporter protein [Blastochloris viridis]BAS00380.1 hypothetical protein BV133_2786 [Blastochloris viridis]